MSETPRSPAPDSNVATSTPASYHGQQVALLTQHGKLQALAPALEQGLGCAVRLVTGYDTDLLGTFTRDIARVGTQLEAARRQSSCDGIYV